MSKVCPDSIKKAESFVTKENVGTKVDTGTMESTGTIVGAGIKGEDSTRVECPTKEDSGTEDSRKGAIDFMRGMQFSNFTGCVIKLS